VGDCRPRLRLTRVDIDEGAGAALVDQQTQRLEFGVPHFAIAPQHLEPALEDGAQAGILAALDEGACIGLLVIGQGDRRFCGHGQVLA
jgi:hypothetical protein